MTPILTKDNAQHTEQVMPPEEQVVLMLVDNREWWLMLSLEGEHWYTDDGECWPKDHLSGWWWPLPKSWEIRG